jgi:hypothetical protein
MFWKLFHGHGGPLVEILPNPAPSRNPDKTGHLFYQIGRLSMRLSVS